MQSTIFDLDGTLVDSAPGILSALECALSTCQIAPVASLGRSLIGPPLSDILRNVSGSEDARSLHRLADAFKASYDADWCTRVQPYRDIQVMLEELAKLGTRLFIATNKRALPTERIVRQLGWDSIFEAVYGLDSFGESVTSKASLLGRLISEHALDRQSTVYVGDRDEDGLAAQANDLEFVLVTWGYKDAACSVEGSNAWRRMHVPDAASIWPEDVLELRCRAGNEGRVS